MVRGCIFIVAVCFFLFSGKMAGQVKNILYKRQSSTVIIKGRVPRALVRDTAFLSFQKEFIYTNVGMENYTSVCDNNGYFQFKISNISHPARVTLLMKSENMPIIINYYVEPGDSIFISLIKTSMGDSAIFSGKGFMKFNCMAALRTDKEILENQIEIKYQRILTSGVNKLLQIFLLNDTLGKNLLTVLSKYKKLVSPLIYEILRFDIIGSDYKDRCLTLNYSLRQDSLEKKKMNQLFLNAVYQPVEKIQTAAGVFSEDYIEYLFRRAQNKILFQHGLEYSMTEMFFLLAKEYKGIIRDRILVTYLLRGHIAITNTEYEYCLKQAIKIMGDRMYKNYLIKQLHHQEKGSVAYNFSLPDSSGKDIQLSMYRGKIVLMDFWFSGCYSCGKFSETLEKEVINNFNDSSVVFVSICIDKEKDKWLKSLQSGHYSTPRSINVYTEGKGLDHPVVKYYNIQGCPYILLIDREGNIYSATPPREGKELCSLINEAMK